jgi:hypothetical protein
MRGNDVYPKEASSKGHKVASKVYKKSTLYLTLRKPLPTMSRSSVISSERAKIAHDLRQSIGELKDRGLLVAAKW